MKRISIIVSLVVLFVSGFGQSYLQHYTVKEGLSSNFIYSTFITQDGMLWAATAAGVCYFNGSKWVWFDPSTGTVTKEKNGVSFSAITEDSKGDLWFASFTNGVYRCNLKKGTAINYTTSNSHWLTTNYISWIQKIDSAIIISTQRGFRVFTEKNVVNPLKNTAWDSNYIVKCEKKGNTYFASTYTEGVLELNSLCENTSVNRIGLKSSVYVVETDTFLNTLLIATSNGIYQIKERVSVELDVFLQNRKLKSEFYLGVLHANNNLYLLSSKRGILKVKEFNGHRLDCEVFNTSEKEIVNNLFTSLRYDHNRNTLINSSWNGILIHSLNTKPFKNYKVKSADNSTILSVYPLDSMHTLLGTYNGLLLHTRLNNSTKEIQGIHAPVRTINKIKGIIFVSTQHGLFTFDRDKLHSFQLPNLSAQSDNFAFGFFASMSDSLVVFSSEAENAMLIWNTKSNTVFFQKLKRTYTSILGINQIESNVFVFSSNEGIYKVTIGVPFSENKVDFNEHLMDNMIDICKANDGTIFAGGHFQGVIHLTDKMNRVLNQFTTNNGMLSNDILSLSRIGNKVYAVSSAGVQAIGEKPKEVFTSSDGFVSEDFMTGSKYFDERYLFLGHSNSYSVLDSYLPLNKMEATLNLVNVVSLENNKTKKEVFTGNLLTLPYFRNTIRLDVASSLYHYPERNKIYYEINGQQFITEDNHSIQLTQLAPGSYLLKIYSDPILCNSTPLLFNIEINAPWWKTNWFRILLFFVLTGVVLIIVRFYYRYRLKEKTVEIERLKAIQNERERISSDLHDDLGSHVSSMQLMTSLLEKQEPIESKRMELAQLKTESMELNQKVRDIVWATKIQYDNLPDLIHYLQKHASTTCEKMGIKLTMNHPDNIPSNKLDSEKRKDIYLVFKECLNNILKHSKATGVKIEFIIEQKQVILKVEDNGIGLPEHPVGNGLKIMQQRMERHDGTIYFENQVQGLQVIISWPITQK